MKTLRNTFALLLAAAAVGLSSGLAAAEPRVLIDFADSSVDPDGTKIHAYEYAWEDFGNNHVIDLRRRGVLIQAPSGKGGLGENRTAVKFSKTPAIDLVYVIGNANNAKGLTFSLTDGDGTQAQWFLSFEGQPKGKPLNKHMVLASPDNINQPGKQPGLDVKRISGWSIGGNYQPENVEVLLVSLLGTQ